MYNPFDSNDINLNNMSIVMKQARQQFDSTLGSLKEHELLYVIPSDLAQLKRMFSINNLNRNDYTQISKEYIEVQTLYQEIIMHLEGYLFDKLNLEKEKYDIIKISDYLYGYKDASISRLNKYLEEHNNFLDTVKTLVNTEEVKIYDELYRDMVTPGLQSFELNINMINELKDKNIVVHPNEISYDYSKAKEFNIHNIGRVFDCSNTENFLDLEIQKFIRENIKKFNEKLEVSFEDNPRGILYNSDTDEIIVLDLINRFNSTDRMNNERFAIVNIYETKHVLNDGKVKISYIAQKRFYDSITPFILFSGLLLHYMFDSYNQHIIGTNPSAVIEKALQIATVFKINNIDLNSMNYDSRKDAIESLVFERSREKFIQDIIQFIVSQKIDNIIDVYDYIVTSELFKTQKARIIKKINQESIQSSGFFGSRVAQQQPSVLGFRV